MLSRMMARNTSHGSRGTVHGEAHMSYTVAKGNQMVDPDDVAPVEGVVDLRSDTVTRPSEEMRRAMAAAEVGDDVYGEDPTVNRLQKRAAEMFGKEAALFVPTGCMGNLVCIKIWTHHGSEVICEERSHVNLYELASMSAIAGCMPRATRGSDDGILTWKQIEAVVRPKIYYDSQTALVCLENTSNMAGGTVYPTERVNDICEHAHALGLKVHLDGARIFNAAVALGDDVARMTEKVDSVMFCLSKGLGAPVGSMIAGSKEFIERARIYRDVWRRDAAGGRACGGGADCAGKVACAAARRSRQCQALGAGHRGDSGIEDRSGEREEQHRDFRLHGERDDRGGTVRRAARQRRVGAGYGSVCGAHGDTLERGSRGDREGAGGVARRFGEEGKIENRKEKREKRRGCVALDRKSPPFAEKREGWGTLRGSG